MYTPFSDAEYMYTHFSDAEYMYTHFSDAEYMYTYFNDVEYIYTHFSDAEYMYTHFKKSVNWLCQIKLLTQHKCILSYYSYIVNYSKDNTVTQTKWNNQLFCLEDICSLSFFITL